MGMRIRKSFKVAPGVRATIGGKSSSISFGGKGVRKTISTSGRTTSSVHVAPGVSYVSSKSSGSRAATRNTSSSSGTRAAVSSSSKQKFMFNDPTHRKSKSFYNGMKIYFIVMAVLFGLISIFDPIVGIVLCALSIMFAIMSKNTVAAYDDQEITEGSNDAKPKVVVSQQIPAESHIAQQNTAKVPESSTKEAVVYVTGTAYHKKEINELVEDLTNVLLYESDSYSESKKELLDEGIYDEDDKIWQFEPSVIEVKIVPEPDNKYDKNALQVYGLGSDDTPYLIGYIPKENISEINEAMKAGTAMTMKISGGKYKYISTDEDGNEILKRGSADYHFNIIFKKAI